tara:strand:+ start:122 stop:805 length:684 start_codon:yes stop_codon:yes gene_type:complete
MHKIYKIIILLIFFTIPFSSNAHVQHYDDLNRIEFDIFRNNKQIGKHIFTFVRSDKQLKVISKINFKIKKLGVVLYRYSAEGTEVFENGDLIKFNSTTNQNKKNKFVNLKLDKNEYIIEGSSYKGKAPKDYILGTWWNHSIVKAKAQISAVSGRIIHQKVNFIGKEQIKINNKTYNTLHFQFVSTDKKLSKDKKLNTHVWYDEETLNWVKASFDKKGKWEYRLLSIN